MDQRQPRARTGRQVRYAVAGLGHIAQVAVLPAFANATRNSELVALISSDAEKLSELGDRYGVGVRGGYDEYERCLEDVDAVYIALPNSMHAEFTMRAARAGVHVLCEKPLAVTSSQCASMIHACAQADVRLMTAYRLHFDRTTLWALEQARAGRIGDLRYFNSSFSMRAKPGNIRTRPETGGGTLYDLGVYCINAARMFFGSEPYEVFASSIDGDEAGMPGVDATTSAVLRFEGDRLATFTTSFDAADVSSLRVAGTLGDLRMAPAYEYAEPLVCELTIDEKTTTRRGRKADQFAPELIYFSDCILKDRQPEPSGDEGAQDVRIVEALYQSARDGRVVRLKPFSEDSAPERGQAMHRPPVRERETINTEPPHD